MPLLPASLTPVTDTTGVIRLDSRIYVYEAGTTQPAEIYYDSALDILAPNPLPAVGGRVPPLYVGTGEYRIRATSTTGTEFFDFDGIVITASTVAGGDDTGTVDPNALWQTGDIKDRYGTGAHAGWLRLNGLTIGPDGSGASARANPDTYALYIHLWTQDTNLAVIGGRGVSADADWSAAKPITLPDARGRARVTVDGLGTAASGRLAGAQFSTGGTATTLGSYGGEATHILSQNQLPAHTHGASGSTASAGSHDHTGTTVAAGGHNHEITIAAGGTHTHAGTTAGGGNHAHTLNINSAGSHSHGASADPNGSHSHTYGTATLKNATATITGSGANGLWYNGTSNDTTSTSNDHSHAITVNSGGAHTHAGDTDNSGTHTHAFSITSSGSHAHTASSGNEPAHTHTFTTAASGSHTHPITVTITETGAGQEFSKLPPFLLISTYIKL